MNIENIEIPDEIKEYMRSSIDYYLEQFEYIKNSKGENYTLLEIYKLIDDINSKNIKKRTEKEGKTPSCRKGCSFCCNIQVVCTELEVNLIIKYIKDNNIILTDEEKNRLKEQSKYNLRSDVEKYILNPYKKCVFLKNNECSIYPIRPLSCRNYFVYNDPKLCDTDNKNGNGRVEIDFNLESIAVILTILRLSKENTLSKLLNEKLNES